MYLQRLREQDENRKPGPNRRSCTECIGRKRPVVTVEPIQPSSRVMPKQESVPVRQTFPRPRGVLAGHAGVFSP